MTQPVLVVDDEPSIRALVRTVLEDDGYAVTEAGNGQEALQRIAEQPPSLMLLDLNMPVMTGWAVQDALVRQHRTLPVVVMSAERPLPAAPAGSPVVAYLPKPFDLDRLVKLVERFAA